MNYKRFPLVYGVYKHGFPECEETEKLCRGFVICGGMGKNTI